ncbi:MAG TPA: hypothetical protein DCS93_27950 [Microscillaceae bacterium]|nr:hypothetical protein [Microscillaceae bacterium]
MLENLSIQDAENIDRLIMASYQQKLEKSSSPFLGPHMRKALNIEDDPEARSYLEKLLRGIQEFLDDSFLSARITEGPGQYSTELRITSNGLLKDFLEKGGFVNVWHQEQERKKQEEEEQQAANRLAKIGLEIKKLQKKELMYKEDIQEIEKEVNELNKLTKTSLQYKKRGRWIIYAAFIITIVSVVVKCTV